MREMDITPIYPKMNLSKRMKQAKVCPYLLRNAVIDRPNPAWSIDITYIPMKQEKPSEGISTPITLKDAISLLETNAPLRYTIR